MSEISPILYPVLVLNIGGVSALQYCTGDLYASEAKNRQILRYHLNAGWPIKSLDKHHRAPQHEDTDLLASVLLFLIILSFSLVYPFI